jgi:group I intron endonuclease
MTVTIYCAYCICTGKKYIGQTTKDLKIRISEHKNSFNKSKTIKFYNAIRKYGFEKFIWGIIEEGNSDIWNIREVYWIERFNTYSNGYNTTKGGNNRSIYLPNCKKYEIMSPYGKIIKGKNISKFCRENGLSIRNISNVLSGKVKSCKGWKLPSTELIGLESRALTTSRDYELMSPDGKIIKGRNVSELCRKYNLKSSAISRILNGKLCSYKGWKLPSTKLFGRSVTSKKLEREYELVSPDGQLFQSKGVRTLCRKFNLSESAISQVLNGKRKQCKGWRKK